MRDPGFPNIKNPKMDLKTIIKDNWQKQMKPKVPI